MEPCRSKHDQSSVSAAQRVSLLTQPNPGRSTKQYRLMEPLAIAASANCHKPSSTVPSPASKSTVGSLLPWVSVWLPRQYTCRRYLSLSTTVALKVSIIRTELELVFGLDNDTGQARSSRVVQTEGCLQYSLPGGARPASRARNTSVHVVRKRTTVRMTIAKLDTRTAVHSPTVRRDS